MQAFGVDLGIDAAERHKLHRHGSEPPSRRPHSEIVSTMKAFGVDLDIDARHRRGQVVGSHQPMSMSERAQFAVNSGDIGRVMTKKHFLDEGLVHGKIPDVSHSPDLAAGRASRDNCYGFFEHKIVSERWAELMARPIKGIGKSSVWQEEVQQGKKMLHDVPEDAQVLLHALERGLCNTPVKQRSSSARQAPKCVDQLPGHVLSASLLELSCNDLLENVEEECHDYASTASGDDGPSPEVMSITPGTATPDITDSESDHGVYHIVNAPRGTHSLLRSNNVNVATSCHSLDLPLGFRRVMAAVLPADPDSSLQLSSEQMRTLSGLNSALQTQKKRPSIHRMSRTPRTCPNSKRPTWQ